MLSSLESKILRSVRFVATLDDETTKEYDLVLDFNAAVLVYDQIQKEIFVGSFWDQVSPRELLVVFWASFRRNHPDVTMEDAGRMLSPTQRNAVWSAMVELIFPGVLDQIRQSGNKPTGEPPPNSLTATA